jgi:DNA (cytosine-5)-methyltransferase 1
VKYLSVCSGIEAASKAWEPIGWQPAAFSEIEPFPAAVLKHHWPEVPNLGDMTKYEQWPIQSGTIDLLVGGTPCQSFSVAGLRQGLKDPRGNLMLTYLAIAERLKPRWLVWENVPGVLSSNGGKDFGSFLGALGELGYEWAYRVLDAQWFGVAQRRRRVFVVAHLGKGNLAAKVLFESESVRRNPAPSREAGQGVAADVETGVGGGDKLDGFRMQAFGEYANDGTASAMKARDYKDATDLVASPVIIDRAAFNQGENAQYKPRIKHGETMDSLVARGPHAVLFENHPNDSRVTGPHDVAPSCVSRYGTGGINPADRMAVRRLTPRECERLQGFPDDHTLISWRGKPADQCPDGPRYKALGNSMAVPCMAWIGKRIERIENERQGAV